MNEQKMRGECEEIRIDEGSYGRPCHKEAAWRIYQAACASKQQEIEELHALLMTSEIERNELAAQVEVMRGALQWCNIEFGLSNNTRVRRTLTITPPEALAQHDAGVAAQALEDAADWFESSPETNPFSTRDILRNKAAAIRMLK